VFGRRIGVILTGLTREEKEMLGEFERGFSESEETRRIIIEELGTATDRVKAVRAVENLLNRDVKVFFVKAYGLNTACVEKIANAGGYFIIEDFSAFRLFPERLFLAIEDDHAQAIESILKQGKNAWNSPITISGAVREGEVLRQADIAHD